MIYSQRCIAIFHQRCCLNDTKITNIWWIIDTKNSLWNRFICRILNQMNDKMKKLMNLLNEYLIEIERWFTVNYRNEEFKCFDDLEETWRNINQELLILKSFKFIERLFERKKIDENKLRWANPYFRLEWWWIFKSAKEKRYYTALMLLAITDEPMKLLSSILK